MLNDNFDLLDLICGVLGSSEIVIYFLCFHYKSLCFETFNVSPIIVTLG